VHLHVVADQVGPEASKEALMLNHKATSGSLLAVHIHTVCISKHEARQHCKHMRVNDHRVVQHCSVVRHVCKGSA
jgi:hypothetical protein